MKKFESLFTIQNSIKEFFNKESFLEVITPPIVINPGMETHIHPFEIYSVNNRKNLGLYLHTSPEFHMKSLLAQGYENIFTLGYSFRDEPNSETHRKQFLMLEWYRANSRYEAIMQDTENLIKFCFNKLQKLGIPLAFTEISFTKLTVNEAFKKYLNFEILEFLDKEKLYNLISQNFKSIHLAPLEMLSWDDLFFLLMYNEIEPHFKEIDFLLLYEFPEPLKALSTIKGNDSRVCERFEIYSKGVELCNCFNELTNLKEQKLRFSNQKREKFDLYGYTLPDADVLYNALERGIPESAGIALGVERLLKSLTGLQNPFWD